MAASAASAADAPIDMIDLGLPPVPPAAGSPEPVAAAPAQPAPPPQAALAAEPAVPEIEIETPAPAPESGPFVTETMAELYLQQGHREEALRVYRALLAERPGDSGLAAKIAVLEGAAAPAAAAPMVPAADHAHGPTIRAVLLLVAQRRPGYRPEGATNGATPHVSESAPAASRIVADQLGALWGNAAPSDVEEGAAIMLATAFADLIGMTSSAPEVSASGASTAGASGPPPGPPSSFSFDRFFSQRVTAEHAATPGTPAQTESKEDVAQFTRWLEGLKQQ